MRHLPPAPFMSMPTRASLAHDCQVDATELVLGCWPEAAEAAEAGNGSDWRALVQLALSDALSGGVSGSLGGEALVVQAAQPSSGSGLWAGGDAFSATLPARALHCSSGRAFAMARAMVTPTSACSHLFSLSFFQKLAKE